MLISYSFRRLVNDTIAEKFEDESNVSGEIEIESKLCKPISKITQMSSGAVAIRAVNDSVVRFAGVAASETM